MTKWILAAGAAALAIAPAYADPKGNKGGGKNHADHAQKGGGNKDYVNRGGDKRDLRAKDDRRGNDPRKAERKFARAIDDKPAKGPKIKIKNGGDVHGVRDHAKRDRRLARIDRDDGVRFLPNWTERGLTRGFANGCPPGLAKKGNGCLPQGLGRKVVGTAMPAALASSMLDGPYRLWYRDNDRYMYRWDDDYIYRVQRDGGQIDALFPYANRDYYYYPVGQQYPEYYNYYNVPYQYRGYYPDSNDSWYRYGDGAIYQVNPSSGLIQGIVALLTANPLAVGQPLPATYGVYNVPFAYRDRYYDTPQAAYRYNDGYIYRVDPTTQLITAVIDAIV
ncbi:hypothetical protein [Sphingomonas xanthus]|uniref:RcnB family protein n=1 Tax=Sphingomonas xanthus TaxID=2594473 RepID=A0A516IRT9_9SPHN|nr:hypothetical protein [Sphingomonas xanthus]QDP19605.1 hypothetical protein FMM02_06290 [Sphingomonas xanthus]